MPPADETAAGLAPLVGHTYAWNNIKSLRTTDGTAAASGEPDEARARERDGGDGGDAFVAVAWSPRGVASHGGCLLAVATRWGTVALCEPVREPMQGPWQVVATLDKPLRALKMASPDFAHTQCTPRRGFLGADRRSS